MKKILMERPYYTLKKSNCLNLFKNLFIYFIPAKKLKSQVRKISNRSETFCQINHDSLRNNHNSWKALWLENNVCGDSASYFIYGFAFQVISEQWLAQILLGIWETFYTKKLIPIKLVTNWLLFHFCPFVWIKNNNFFWKLVVWWRKIFVFSLKASRTLLQRHVEFNKLL